MNKSIHLIFLLVLTASTISFSQGAKDFHSWAVTPPMGWNSWDCFGPTVTEDEVKANADYMAANLKKYGWEYLVVDIRWYVENDKAHGYNEKDAVIVMDDYGRLMPAVNRFPSSANGKGFKPLADYIHNKGLKLGIHIMRGISKKAVEKNTPILGSNFKAQDIYSKEQLCAWLGDMYTVDASKQGAQEYYDSLFKLYASWGLDFIKIDDLSRPYHKNEIELIRKAIDKCGRKIVLSTSPGETPIEDAKHVTNHANMWRIIDDFWDNWPELYMHFALFEKWIPYTGIGHWPDGDMLPLGRIGIRAERGDNRLSKFTEDEQLTLMSLFLICRSPLMFGGNLPDNDDFTKKLITNGEALSILQNSRNNRLLFNENDRIAWTADNSISGDKYVALFYASDQSQIEPQNAAWTSELVTFKNGEQKTNINLNLGDAKKLYLVVADGGNGNSWDHADWIEPKLLGKNASINLTDLKWINATSGWETVKINKSIGGNNLIVDGVEYANGIGTHANSIIEYDIPEGYNTFTAVAGLDKECLSHTEGAKVKFHIFTQLPTENPPLDSINIALKFNQLGLRGTCKVRNLWEKKDIGNFNDGISFSVRKHGAMLLKISEVK